MYQKTGLEQNELFYDVYQTQLLGLILYAGCISTLAVVWSWLPGTLPSSNTKRHFCLMLWSQYVSFEYSVHINLNIVKMLLYWPLSSLTISSATRYQHSQNSVKAIDATVYLVDTVLLYDRNSSAPWKHLKKFLWKDARSQVPVASEYIPNMIKHFLTVFCPPAKSSSNLCCHKPIRSAEIWKQNRFKHTCLQPTHMACCSSNQISNAYIPSGSILSCV